MNGALRERANVEFESDGVFVCLQVAFLLQKVDAEELVVAPARALLEVGREFAHYALVGTRSVQKLNAILIRRCFTSTLHHLRGKIEKRKLKESATSWWISTDKHQYAKENERFKWGWCEKVWQIFYLQKHRKMGTLRRATAIGIHLTLQNHMLEA